MFTGGFGCLLFRTFMPERSMFSTGPPHYEYLPFKWLFHSSTFTRLSPSTGIFIFLPGQAHLSFPVLFNVLTDLIEMTQKIYGIWSWSTLCLIFSFSGKMAKKILPLIISFLIYLSTYLIASHHILPVYTIHSLKKLSFVLYHRRLTPHSRFFFK